MEKSPEQRKYKNSFLNWIDFAFLSYRILKKNIKIIPMPKNCNYFWSFGALSDNTASHFNR